MLNASVFRDFQLTMKCRATVFLFGFSFFSLLSLGIHSAAVAAVTADDRFLAARDAARSADRTRLDRLANELQHHDLAAYVAYWRVSLDLNGVDPAVVREFLDRHEKSYLAEKLRGEWLKQLGKAQQWADFDVEFPKLVQPDQSLVCYALQSRWARGDASVSDEALPLWLTLTEPPESCYPVLEALIVEKRVLADEVWGRVLAWARDHVTVTMHEAIMGEAAAAEVQA